MNKRYEKKLKTNSLWNKTKKEPCIPDQRLWVSGSLTHRDTTKGTGHPSHRLGPGATNRPAPNTQAKPVATSCGNIRPANFTGQVLKKFPARQSYRKHALKHDQNNDQYE